MRTESEDGREPLWILICESPEWERKRGKIMMDMILRRNILVTDGKPAADCIDEMYKSGNGMRVDDRTYRAAWRVLKKDGNRKIGAIAAYSQLPGDYLYKYRDPEKGVNETIAVDGSCMSSICAGCKGPCYAIRGMEVYGCKFDSDDVCNVRPGSIELGYFRRGYFFREYPLDWIHDIILQIRNQHIKCVRINVSGELMGILQYKSWTVIADSCPNTAFYLYTKDFRTLSHLRCDPGARLTDNMHINVSIWHDLGISDFKHLRDRYGARIHAFVYDDHYDYGTAFARRGLILQYKWNACHCPGYLESGKRRKKGVKLPNGKKAKKDSKSCADCRLCIDRPYETGVIVCWAHP